MNDQLEEIMILVKDNSRIKLNDARKQLGQVRSYVGNHVPRENVEQLAEQLNGVIKRSKKQEETAVKKNKIIKSLAVVGAIAVVCAAAYAVYKFLRPDYLEDFEDDLDDEFDDYFEDDEDPIEPEVSTADKVIEKANDAVEGVKEKVSDLAEDVKEKFAD